jgi:hypothetical protein
MSSLRRSQKLQATSQPAISDPAALSSEVRPAVAEFSAAAIERAARLLAPHVGPVSTVIAKKAARRSDSLRTLYVLLAEHVQGATERHRFLRDAGFPDAGQ